MNQSVSLQHLAQQLTTDSIVVTANQRLATLVRLTYDEQQQQQGLLAWPSLTVQPLNNWLSSCWLQLHPAKLLLNEQQEHVLWQRIIRQHAEFVPCLQIAATAELVQQAWHLQHHWLLSRPQLMEYQHNQQIDCFIQWSQYFQEYCQQQNWLTTAELPNQLITAISQQQLHLPAHLFFVGFDELSPLLQQLTSFLAQQCEPALVQLTAAQGLCQQLTAIDQEQEIATFISWAAQLLQNNPDYQIGCIIPNLAACRNKIANELDNAFAIHSKLPGTLDEPLPYNISAGQSLQQFAIIEIASQTLMLLKGSFQLETIGTLLQSRYLHQHAEDADFGAAIDYQLREKNCIFEQPLSQLFHSISRLIEHFPQQTWLHRWRAFCHTIKHQEEYALPSVWAQYFALQLTAIGWPGYHDLNSLEYQLVQRWQQLLNEMAYFDILYEQIDLTTALHVLQTLTQRTLFQAQGNPQARIQVLGILESAGYFFDALWVMGLHDEAWPPPAAANPFLPFALQQQLNMPNATAARQLAYTQQLTQRLLHSANHIILSSPQREDEKILRPSQLIQAIDTINLDQLRLFSTPSFTQTIYDSQHNHLEIIIDQHAPAISSNELIRGGSAILTEQATCPFRSFALLRLKAKPLPELHYALTAKHRGILLHRVLACVWSELQQQSSLHNYSDLQLQQLLNTHISAAVQQVFNHLERAALQELLHIEQQRLHIIIRDWLELEKRRSAFSVAACEQQCTIQLGDLQLSVQIDRIDTLSNGQSMIIDYKTGHTLSIKSWLGTRPEQPQLPLYCLYDYQQTNCENKQQSCITFAQIRANKTQFIGICAENTANPLGDIKGIIAVDRLKEENEYQTWQDLQHHWHTVLTQLADDFTAGDARTDPIHGIKTCQHCDLQGLCRKFSGV